MTSETRVGGDTKQTPTRVAARSLGVSEARLAAVSTNLNRPAVAAVGAALAVVIKDEPERMLAGGNAKSAPVWTIAETAQGDVAVPQSAMVLVPAGLVADHEVVARLHQAEWEATLEVFTTVDRMVALRSAFRAWVVETTSTASPFRFGQFTVEADNKGVNLTRWEAGEVSRDDLLLPTHVWETVDRHVHGSLAMSERLASAGLDGNVMLWDAKTGRLILSFEVDGPALGVAWSADGAKLSALTDKGTVKVWDAGRSD